MAATSILSTDDEMNAMAGENVDVTGWTDANKTAWGLQAESNVCVFSRYDWVTNVGSTSSIFAKLLSEYVARYTALQGILYNMAGYSDRIEAEDMCTTHWARINQITKMLSDEENVTFMTGL